MYDKASIALIPSGYKGGGEDNLYSVLPANGDGDFDFSRGSTATRVNKDGLIETVGDDTPRLDYPLTNGVVGDCPHLLLEPQSTNLIPYSEDLTTGWTTSAATITADTQISPDGSQTADTITVTGNSGGVYTDNITVIASTSYTFSFYVKRGTISDSETALAVRNQTAGTFINTDTSYSANADNWTRIEHTFTTPVGCTSVRLYPQRLSNGGQGTIFVWGCQLEEGSYATSYIKTQGEVGGVTRSADICNDSGTSAEFNDSEGVLFVEIAALTQTLGSSSETISISDGTSDNRIVIYHKRNLSNTISYGIVSNNLGWFFESFIISDITSLHKVAFKFKQNDCSLWIDGNEVDTQTSVLMPSGLNTLRFESGSGSNDFYGKCKQLIVFNEALSDSELQTLTS